MKEENFTKIINLEGGADFDEIVGMMNESFGEELPVAIPTETVYGLAAPYDSEATILNIYKIKQRPADNPLIVHIANFEQLEELVEMDFVDDRLREVLDEFWPGPLTVLFPKKKIVPDVVTAGSEMVAVRMPGLEVVRDLIEKLGVPLVAPSANLSGKPSPTSASDVKEDLDGKVKLILDGGQCEYGLESTIVKVKEDGSAVILRAGEVTKEMLGAFFEEVKYAKDSESENPEAPGMKYKHYSPVFSKVFLIGREAESLKMFEKMWRLKGRESIFLGIKGGIANKIQEFKGNTSEKMIRLFDSENDLAKSLFAIFREADRGKIEYVFVECPVENMALLNRLRKAEYSAMDVEIRKAEYLKYMKNQGAILNSLEPIWGLLGFLFKKLAGLAKVLIIVLVSFAMGALIIYFFVPLMTTLLGFIILFIFYLLIKK